MREENSLSLKLTRLSSLLMLLPMSRVPLKALPSRILHKVTSSSRHLIISRPKVGECLSEHLHLIQLRAAEKPCRHGAVEPPRLYDP